MELDLNSCRFGSFVFIILVVLHVLLVDDLGAEVNVLDLLLLHLVVLFLGHHAHILLVVVLILNRILSSDVVDAAVQEVLPAVDFSILCEVVEIEVGII